MTPRQRGRLGGLARNAMYDGREMTAKARQAARDRFLEQVDPLGELRRRDPRRPRGGQRWRESCSLRASPTSQPQSAPEGKEADFRG